MVIFDDYWKKLERANSELKSADRLTLSIPVFKRLVEEAFAAGRASQADQKAADDFGKFGRTKGPIASIFDDLFRY